MKTFQTSQVRDFDSVDWFRESYSAQDVLIKHVKYPTFSYEGDWIGSVYNDRQRKDWSRAQEKAGFGNNADGWSTFSDEELLLFAKELFQRGDIQGCRLIRFTDMSSGFPLWRLDAFKSNNEGAEYNFSPNYKEEELYIELPDGMFLSNRLYKHK